MLFIDNEPGAHVVSVAADFSQANLTFDNAKKFIEASPALRRRCVVKQYEITVPKTKSKWSIMSGSGEGKHGIRPTCVLADEAHEWKSRQMYDSIGANLHKRRQPLMIVATNAGESGESICWELHERARAVMTGISEDETLYPRHLHNRPGH
jgi:phage terminase large subunit-like protein